MTTLVSSHPIYDDCTVVDGPAQNESNSYAFQPVTDISSEGMERERNALSLIQRRSHVIVKPLPVRLTKSASYAQPPKGLSTGCETEHDRYLRTSHSKGNGVEDSCNRGDSSNIVPLIDFSTIEQIEAKRTAFRQHNPSSKSKKTTDFRQVASAGAIHGEGVGKCCDGEIPPNASDNGVGPPSVNELYSAGQCTSLPCNKTTETKNKTKAKKKGTNVNTSHHAQSMLFGVIPARGHSPVSVSSSRWGFEKMRRGRHALLCGKQFTLANSESNLVRAYTNPKIHLRCRPCAEENRYSLITRPNGAEHRYQSRSPRRKRQRSYPEQQEPKADIKATAPALPKKSVTFADTNLVFSSRKATNHFPLSRKKLQNSYAYGEKDASRKNLLFSDDHDCYHGRSLSADVRSGKRLPGACKFASKHARSQNKSLSGAAHRNINGILKDNQSCRRNADENRFGFWNSLQPGLAVIDSKSRKILRRQRELYQSKQCLGADLRKNGMHDLRETMHISMVGDSHSRARDGKYTGLLGTDKLKKKIKDPSTSKTKPQKLSGRRPLKSKHLRKKHISLPPAVRSALFYNPVQSKSAPFHLPAQPRLQGDSGAGINLSLVPVSKLPSKAHEHLDYRINRRSRKKHLTLTDPDLCGLRVGEARTEWLIKAKGTHLPHKPLGSSAGTGSHPDANGWSAHAFKCNNKKKKLVADVQQHFEPTKTKHAQSRPGHSPLCFGKRKSAVQTETPVYTSKEKLLSVPEHKIIYMDRMDPGSILFWGSPNSSYREWSTTKSVNPCSNVSRRHLDESPPRKSADPCQHAKPIVVSGARHDDLLAKSRAAIWSDKKRDMAQSGNKEFNFADVCDESRMSISKKPKCFDSGGESVNCLLETNVLTSEIEAKWQNNSEYIKHKCVEGTGKEPHPEISGFPGHDKRSSCFSTKSKSHDIRVTRCEEKTCGHETDKCILPKDARLPFFPVKAKAAEAPGPNEHARSFSNLDLPVSDIKSFHANSKQCALMPKNAPPIISDNDFEVINVISMAPNSLARGTTIHAPSGHVRPGSYVVSNVSPARSSFHTLSRASCRCLRSVSQKLLVATGPDKILSPVPRPTKWRNYFDMFSFEPITRHIFS